MANCSLSRFYRKRLPLAAVTAVTVPKLPSGGVAQMVLERCATPVGSITLN